MKLAREIFLTVGIPMPKGGRERYEGLHRDYRAFNEHDIATIQREGQLFGEESLRAAYRRELDEAREGMDLAMRIIEKVGTTGIEHAHKDAEAWLKRYCPTRL